MKNTELRKRPMASVSTIRLISRQVIERLSVAGVELILAKAKKITEGQVADDAQYFGSTMVTIDLEQLDLLISDTCDVLTANRLTEQLTEEADSLGLLKALAKREARRVAQREFETIEIDIRVRSEGHWIFVDMDVEGSVSAAVETTTPAASQIG
jgi:hypothetical protein